MKKTCDVCKDKLESNFIDLGMQPLCDEVVKFNSKKKNKFYRIKVVLCKKCYTVNQLYKVKQEKLFPKKYTYRSGITKQVQQAMMKLTNDITSKIKNDKKEKIVVDVGCNDGTLLNYFLKKKFVTYGIEPTNAYKDANKKHKIYNSVFHENILRQILRKHRRIDIMTFTNVFAHIPDFDYVLKVLRANSEKIDYLVIENHYLGAILKLNQFDTFYQEHPRTYSLHSFVNIANKINMKVYDVSFPERYGGNIRVILSKKESKKAHVKKILFKEKKFISHFNQLKKNIIKWKKNKLIELNKIRKKNYIFAKAFPGRASILLNLLKANNELITFIFEQNISKKIFSFAPGTNIKIYPDRMLKNFLKSKTNVVFLNLAWHIYPEIKKYLRTKMKIKNKIINVIEQKDFK